MSNVIEFKATDMFANIAHFAVARVATRERKLQTKVKPQEVTVNPVDIRHFLLAMSTNHSSNVLHALLDGRYLGIHGTIPVPNEALREDGWEDARVHDIAREVFEDLIRSRSLGYPELDLLLSYAKVCQEGDDFFAENQLNADIILHAVLEHLSRVNGGNGGLSGDQEVA